MGGCSLRRNMSATLAKSRIEKALAAMICN